MKTTKILIGAISIVAAVAAARLDAQTFSATLTGYSPVASVNGTIYGTPFQNYPSGVMSFVGFDAFCVQPEQSLGYPETLTYAIQNIGNLDNSTQIALLVGGYLVNAATLPGGYSAGEHAAAAQWAIWEVTNELSAGYSLSSGNVSIDGSTNASIITLGEQYLQDINTFTPATLTYLTNDTRQNVVTWQVVPEPGSALLAAMSALLFCRRRR